MADKKLSFAIFGNDRKALELMQVWEMLDYLSKRNADVFIEETFYRNLCRDLNGDLPVAGCLRATVSKPTMPFPLVATARFSVLPAR